MEKMMQEIQHSKKLAVTPKPCHEFDPIGGTGTGGVIAIMLGRMGMAFNDCIRAYSKFSKTSFHRKMSIRSSTLTFSAAQFESAMKTAIKKNCENSANMLLCDLSCPKTNDDNISACKTWEVARATTAAVSFFKSVKIGRDDIEYIDAAFGHNNPCIGDIIEINEAKPIAKALDNMATRSKQAAMRLKTAYSNSNGYYRFDVENGLKNITLWDWKKTSQISAHTRNYLRENEEAVKRLIEVMTWSSVQQHALELDS
ncbi:hypothetical protein Cpir12675_003511 [Ceratocystis pirilliformis]|uniref:PNPLA domain-containing protein n=1 Tax=Ceratocystis pirilliformis TaxID=259994 RepID=A0ABR3Z2F7_9PEZI